MPLIFSSTEKLAKQLRAWRLANNNAKVPGACRLEPGRLSKTAPRHVTTEEGLAEVMRFKIDEESMGWVLKKRDGSRIFVKPRTGGEPYGNVRYLGWLGGDFGFSNEFIATVSGSSSGELQARQY